MGDYDTNVFHGEPDGVGDGWLHSVWSQPTVTSAACHACQGLQYSIAVKGARVKP